MVDINWIFGASDGLKKPLGRKKLIVSQCIERSAANKLNISKIINAVKLKRCGNTNYFLI